MKVILTEQQFNQLVTEEVILNYLNESIFEKDDLKLFMKSIRNALIGGVAATTIIAAIGRANISDEQKEKLIDAVKNETLANNQEAEKANSTFQQRVDACADCMSFYLGNQGKTLKDTGIKPEKVIEIADKYNFDPAFLLAVLQQESNHGSTPRAKRTNSAFSEGCYDNGKNVVKYNDINDSIEGYISLLLRRYLCNGKTVYDLMVPGKFVDVDGHRYASDPKYESKLNCIYASIIKRFPTLRSRNV